MEREQSQARSVDVRRDWAGSRRKHEPMQMKDVTVVIPNPAVQASSDRELAIVSAVALTCLRYAGAEDNKNTRDQI